VYSQVKSVSQTTVQANSQIDNQYGEPADGLKPAHFPFPPGNKAAKKPKGVERIHEIYD